MTAQVSPTPRAAGAKRHHFVPQFYLRQFANDAGQIMTVDKIEGRTFVQAVANAAAINYFNTVEDPDGGRSNQVEALLAQVESAGASAIDRVMGGEFPPTEQTRQDLTMLLGLQWTRTPRARAMVDRVAAEGSRLLVKVLGPAGVEKALRDAGEETTKAKATAIWESLLDPSLFRISAGQNTQVGLMLDAGMEAARVFAGMAWQLVRFDRRSLLTCDHPIGLWHQITNPWLSFGIGPATAQMVYYPLNRRTALILLPAVCRLDGQRAQQCLFRGFAPCVGDP